MSFAHFQFLGVARIQFAVGWSYRVCLRRDHHCARGESRVLNSMLNHSRKVTIALKVIILGAGVTDAL